MLDRRHEPRATSTFKSAYVRTQSGLFYVTLRNVSDSGVCLDAYPGAAEGDEIQYCFDSAGPRTGVVKWVKDGRFGVSAEADSLANGSPQIFPPRSVRLPLSFSAHLFVNGRQEAVTISNLSIRGACISSPYEFRAGQLVSLKIADRCFELATIRWARQGCAGVRFAEPMHPGEFRNLVERLQQPTVHSHPHASPAQLPALSGMAT